jgi:hypothetical protein
MLKIFYDGGDEDCDVASVPGWITTERDDGDCQESGVYELQDRASGDAFRVCERHKNALKERGLAA